MFICALVNPSDTSIIKRDFISHYSIKMTSQNNTKTEYFASTMDTIAFDNEQIDISNVNLNPECTLTRSTCDGCIFVDGEFIQQNVSIAPSSPDYDSFKEYFAAIMDATVCDNEHIDICNVNLNPECTLTRSTCDGCIFVDGEFIQQNVSIVSSSSPGYDSFELCLQNAYCVSPALRIHHPIPTFVPLFGIVPEHFAEIMDATSER